MFAHYDQVLFKVNLLGGKVLVADAKHNRLFACLGCLRRKVIEVDCIVTIAVYTQPAVAPPSSVNIADLSRIGSYRRPAVILAPDSSGVANFILDRSRNGRKII